ncbi:HlyD family secretion protein [Celeribacter indicus]|nr:HlyD family secretion protein [Celeribacter indicus]
MLPAVVPWGKPPLLLSGMVSMKKPKTKYILLGGLVLVVAIAATVAWDRMNASTLPEGIAAANGRIEATEIDISALTGGRIAEISAAEGDFVTAGDTLVQMDIVQLNAQKREAEAQLRRAEIGVKTAEALVTQAEAQERAAAAAVDQAEAAADAAAQKLARSERLVTSNTVSQQVLDDDRARDRQMKAGLASAEASRAAAVAGVSSAQAQVVDAEAAVDAARAAIDSITASINDATLIAPRDGRIQYRVAQEGEIVASGGRILSLVDLGDVYMTVFLPTSQAGRVQLGSEVRLLMDAVPQYAIPATVSYVADVAQFTPKTVETADEREKLMFRVRARIDPDLLTRYLEYVKTGLPGMAYIRLDPEAEWPAFLSDVAQ